MQLKVKAIRVCLVEWFIYVTLKLWNLFKDVPPMAALDALDKA